MIDPFFFDRLMHVFTAKSPPTNFAAEPGATNRCEPVSPGAAPTCRVIREAEAVVAEVLRRNQSMHTGTPQAEGHV